MQPEINRSRNICRVRVKIAACPALSSDGRRGSAEVET